MPDLSIPFFDVLSQEDALPQEPLIASDETVTEYVNTSRGVGLPRPLEQATEAKTVQALIGEDLSARSEGKAIASGKARAIAPGENRALESREDKASLSSEGTTILPGEVRAKANSEGDARHRPALSSHHRPETPVDSLETVSMGAGPQIRVHGACPCPYSVRSYFLSGDGEPNFAISRNPRIRNARRVSIDRAPRRHSRRGQIDRAPKWHIFRCASQ